MFILSLKNVAEYVRAKTPSNLGIIEVLTTEEVTEETYVNWIYRVQVRSASGPLTLYLRQAGDFVKAKPDIKLPATRIGFEYKMLTLLNKLVPGLTPSVLLFDSENNVLWLSDIKRGCPLLVNELVAGRPHPEVGSYFGQILAQIHGKTIGIPHEAVRGSAKLNEEAIAFHLGMRLKPAQALLPKETKQLVDDGSLSPQCLVLGDLASKNIFVDGKQVRFLDLERAFVGDPAFDLAFLFCHWLMEVPANKRPESITTLDNILRAYSKGISNLLNTKQLNSTMGRISAYLGVTILYRLFGVYLVRDVGLDKDYWKNLAIHLLKEQPLELVPWLNDNLVCS